MGHGTFPRIAFWLISLVGAFYLTDWVTVFDTTITIRYTQMAQETGLRKVGNHSIELRVSNWVIHGISHLFMAIGQWVKSPEWFVLMHTYSAIYNNAKWYYSCCRKKMGIFSTSSPFDSDIGKVLRFLSVCRKQSIFKFQNSINCIHTVVYASVIFWNPTVTLYISVLHNSIVIQCCDSNGLM
jgi:hypothetical protein